MTIFFGTIQSTNDKLQNHGAKFVFIMFNKLTCEVRFHIVYEA